MWIKAGSRYFNTDTIAYIQVSMDEGADEPKSLYLHFLNEQHTFTVHGSEAATIYKAVENWMRHSTLANAGAALISSVSG